MTRKTGAKAVKARQLARAAKVIKYKQKLKNAGESLSLPKPSKEVQKQKDAELRKLYLELVSEKGEQQEKAAESEQPQEQTEQQPAESSAQNGVATEQATNAKQEVTTRGHAPRFAGKAGQHLHSR